jgi:flagellin-specific chaperone FliS
MIIASQKRKENIAEYLLYMWQIEDIIRAYGLDIDKIQANVIDKFPGLTPEQRKQMTEWYESLIDMMRREEVTEKGHLQINRNTLSELTDLHRQLLATPKFGDYSELFYRTLPFIVELRAKAGGEARGELETCFNALYGMLMLKLRKADISADTAGAMAQISKFIATLAAYFHKNEAESIFEPKDE